MGNKIKIGLVGCGAIGKRHAEHINNYGFLQAVCDIKKERADELADIYNCNKYYNIEELLINEPEIELVSICTPNGLHSEHTIKSLINRKHVLVEKPMAIKVKDCELMIKTSEYNNRRLFVVKQNRFNEPVQILKKLLEENKLGKILSFQLSCFWNRNEQYYLSSDWKGTKELDGGTLFTQFSHFIDILHWLFGDVKDSKSILANSNHKNLIQFEDSGVIIFEFENNVIGAMNYNVNSYKKNMEGSLTVFGEKGTYKIGGQYLNTIEYCNVDDFEPKSIIETQAANDYGYYIGSMSNHNKVYENIINVFSNDGHIITSVIDGLKTVQIIENIYKNSDFI